MRGSIFIELRSNLALNEACNVPSEGPSGAPDVQGGQLPPADGRADAETGFDRPVDQSRVRSQIELDGRRDP